MSEKKKENNDQKININWFPGHMTKARREIEANLKVVDMIIELRDARIPKSSKNPMIDKIINQKPRLIFLTKKDKADPVVVEQWIKSLSNEQTKVIALDNFNDNVKQILIQECKTLMKPMIDRMIRKGIRPRAIRAMVIGIPNVGKSTLINRVVNKKIAETADRPGVTKSLKWIKLNKDLELLDTPGILWPKFEDKEVGYHLALIGSMNDQILPLQELSYHAIDILKEHYPQSLIDRYQVDLNKVSHEMFKEIALNRQWLLRGNEIDDEKTAKVFLNELRDGLLGRYCLEFPDATS
ncbi:MAG: ribosome biogenesis GTPase YlqF [Erysipelotrichaceae bacterium]